MRSPKFVNPAHERVLRLRIKRDMQAANLEGVRARQAVLIRHEAVMIIRAFILVLRVLRHKHCQATSFRQACPWQRCILVACLQHCFELSNLCHALCQRIDSPAFLIVRVARIHACTSTRVSDEPLLIWFCFVCTKLRFWKMDKKEVNKQPAQQEHSRRQGCASKSPPAHHSHPSTGVESSTNPICTRKHTHTHIHTHIHTHTQTYTQTYTYTHTRKHTYSHPPHT